MTTPREWEPWNGRAGRAQEPVAVVIHWYCDNGHAAQVLGCMDIELSGNDVHWSESPWSLTVVRDDVLAYVLECDLCLRGITPLSERGARRFLEPLRALYLEGTEDLVNRINVTAIGGLPKRSP